MHRTHIHIDQFIFEPFEIGTGERGRSIDQTAKSQRINRVTEVENRKKKADVPQNVCLWEGVCVGGEGVLEG